MLSFHEAGPAATCGRSDAGAGDARRGAGPAAGAGRRGPAAAGPGEVLLAVHACGLNFADTLLAAGRYQAKPPLPFAPGMEVCGTVTALGPGVRGRRPAPASPPTPATAASPSRRRPGRPLRRRARAMPDAEVAGFLIAYATSQLALASGPASGCARRSGARRLRRRRPDRGRGRGLPRRAGRRGRPRSRTAGHRPRRRGGGPIDSGADIRAEVKALGGADVVYDPVGGAAFAAALRAPQTRRAAAADRLCQRRGAEVPANLVLVKNLAVLGFTSTDGPARAPRGVRASLETLFAWYAQGRLQPHVSHVLPLEAAEAGLDLLRGRRATGKVVVRSPVTRPRGSPRRRRTGAPTPPAARPAPRAGRCPVYMSMKWSGSSGSAAAVAHRLRAHRHRRLPLHADREIGRDAGVHRRGRDRNRPRTPRGGRRGPSPPSPAA